MEEVDLFAGLPVCGFGWWSDVLTTEVFIFEKYLMGFGDLILCGRCFSFFSDCWCGNLQLKSVKYGVYLMYSLSTIKHLGKKATKILPHVELIVKSHTLQHNQASKKTMQLVILKEISIKLLKKRKRNFN